MTESASESRRVGFAAHRTIALVALLSIAAPGVLAIDKDAGARSSSYPKFCATASRLDSIPGDAASVVSNATAIEQVLADIEQLPSSKRPAGAAEAARKARTQLASWMTGAGYAGLEPLPSALEKWQTTARTLRSTIRSECGKDVAAAFLGSRLPRAPSAPRPVTGWTIPGVRTLCVDTANVVFEGAPVAYSDVVDLPNASWPSLREHLLEDREITIVDPGQPCDANLTITMQGSALSDRYGTDEGWVDLYTGYDMSGELTLSAAGQPDLVIPVSYRYPPPFMLSGSADAPLPMTPADAVHGYLFGIGYQLYLSGIMARSYEGASVAFEDQGVHALDQWLGPV